MSKNITAGILKELDTLGAKIGLLLQTYQGQEYARVWQRDPRLYRAFGRKLIRSGYPTKGFELLREGLVYHPHDVELRYLKALALARGGNVSKAMDCAHDLLKEPNLDTYFHVEALSLVGRLCKDRYERTRDPASKTRLARESARAYLSAYQLSQDFFPGINAATMSLLAGQCKRARDIASSIVNQLKDELQQGKRKPDDWFFATLGEGNLLLCDFAEAVHWYGRAVHAAAGDIGDIASMRRQVLLLREKMPIGDAVLETFTIGSVIAFSGHMIDHASRRSQGLPPRFPSNPHLERKVTLAIKRELEALNATVGYSSAACGSDLLFAEQMLERDAELHLILPFDREDFYFTSVDFGSREMSGWRERCDKVLERATEVHYATTENFLGDNVLFEFVNTFTQGLAITRATELGVTPYALVVLDPASQVVLGGTAYFHKIWTDGGHPVRRIDLADLCSKAAHTDSRSSRKPKPPTAGVALSDLRRQVKVMLFADVKNFSKLSEAQAPSFFVKFLTEVAEVIKASKRSKPVSCNTWGDGLFLVFNRVTACADFALRLVDRIEEVDWEKVGLPADTTVRIGIHAGPVYLTKHPILRKNDCFGSHVNRAARIEPVTTPGCAFTSEQFAALLAMEPRHDFVCEYVGMEDLAKGYDRCALYRLGRR